MHLVPALIAIAAMLLTQCPRSLAQDVTRQQAIGVLRKAAEYYRDEVASHGGYVYHYSLDLTQRWGEGEATKDQIWVQPPGTPTVGMAYLKAYQATGDHFYLDAATEAATALVYGQLKSGGWTNAIDFDPNGSRVADYRNGRGRGKNNSSLDDGQTQSATRLIIQVDKALEMSNPQIHRAAVTALNALLAAQFPNGGFPQVWTGPVKAQRVLRASYPDYDWRIEGRIKNYWDMYTLNDNVTGYVADTLIDAHAIYGDDRYLAALKRLGNFLILAQMPQPQPGWAQQYGFSMKPIWARQFEPPAVSGDETQEVVETLLKIASATHDRKYLEPIPQAIAWLKRSALPDGRLARYYELQSNRPLYMIRRGQGYSLSYDDSQLPDHYGWKTPARVSQLSQQFARARTGRSGQTRRASQPLLDQVKQAIATIDNQGRWISVFRNQPLVGQLKLPPGTKYLSSQVFSDNLATLSEFVAR